MQVIDSSAIVKYFSKERGWESLQEIITEGYTIQFALIELGNVLLKKIRGKEMTIGMAHIILQDFVPQIPVFDQNRHVGSAFDIAAVNGIALYDSLFIAAAVGEGCDLVTCDRKQAEIARRHGVRVIEV
ncbi:MAG: type II toxin-antitoxin system VapC family toxin [Candidatus Marsarchaeota archaeon]|nr:type II toxin-antitoxin system VapC family toxin [Candidatus Marsarchaeota archaeon]